MAPSAPALAERDTTVMSGLTMKQESSPMPNCPRKSARASPSSSRFDEAPMVDSREAASSSVRPIPVSEQARPPSPTVRTMRAEQSGSSWRRAAMASTPFCSSSRM